MMLYRLPALDAFQTVYGKRALVDYDFSKKVFDCFCRS